MVNFCVVPQLDKIVYGVQNALLCLSSSDLLNTLQDRKGGVFIVLGI